MLVSQQWYHLAGVYDRAQMMLYVDDQAVATGDYSRAITGDDTVLCLGINGSLTQQLNGKINDVRIYNIALNAEQVEALIR